jgi:hypothetical protein
MQPVPPVIKTPIGFAIKLRFKRLTKGTGLNPRSVIKRRAF